MLDLFEMFVLNEIDESDKQEKLLKELVSQLSPEEFQEACDDCGVNPSYLSSEDVYQLIMYLTS